MAQRVYSNKTRIKTHCKFIFTAIRPNLKEYIPIKQGLRQYTNFFSSKEIYLKEYIPIKQGLRPKLTTNYMMEDTVLKEYIPIKQGLRPLRASIHQFTVFSQRVYSSKTRIKTCNPAPRCSRIVHSKSIFQ